MLIRQLRRAGYDCRALKPIVSGYDADRPEKTDTGQLLEAQDLAITEQAIARTSPWRFAAPVSADIAARREQRDIRLDELVAFCRANDDQDVTLIEGVGGVMSPVSDDCTVLDWIAALGAPVLLVVGSYLGSISHTLTAATALTTLNVAITGIVVNQSDIEPMPIDETVDAIRRHAANVPLVTIPKKEAGDELSAPDLIPLLMSRLDRI